MNWGDVIRIAVPIIAAVVTATAVVSVARWSQPANKARWEAIKAQLEVIEEMDDGEMRDWMDRYVQFEIRFTARKAVDLGLAAWQWIVISIMPIIAAVTWIQAAYNIADFRRQLDFDTVGYDMCLRRGIATSRCTTEALAPETVSETLRSSYYLTFVSVIVAVFFFSSFRWNNNRLSSSRFANFLASNSKRRLPLVELARAFPAETHRRVSQKQEEWTPGPDEGGPAEGSPPAVA